MIPGIDIPTKLAQMQKLSRLKLEKLRRESEDSKLEGCSFQPQVSPIKKGVYSGRPQASSQFSSPIRFVLQ